MQCKDIPDRVFLDAVDETSPMKGQRADLRGWRSRQDVQAVLSGKMGIEIPENLFLAKASRLIDRKLLHGCACGCRGDFHTEDDR